MKIALYTELLQTDPHAEKVSTDNYKLPRVC